MLLLSACTGIMGGIYDEPEEQPKSVDGQLYIDATSWTDWYYIDLKALADDSRRELAIKEAQQPYPIPFPESSAAVVTDHSAIDHQTGIYTYWYDVWGKGIRVNEFRSFQSATEQPAPAAWSLAVHRNNVRTNGGAVYETQLTDIDQLAMSRQELEALPYTTDSWTENVVWAEQSQMLNSLVGSQGIVINQVLSSWLQLEVPPMPPAFTHNNHVFVLRLSDGTFAALQLANYLSPTGTKCFLTIKYRYPI